MRGGVIEQSEIERGKEKASTGSVVEQADHWTKRGHERRSEAEPPP